MTISKMYGTAVKQLLLCFLICSFTSVLSGSEIIFDFAKDQLYYGSDGPLEESPVWQVRRTADSAVLTLKNRKSIGMNYPSVMVYGNKLKRNQWLKDNYLQIHLANRSAFPIKMGLKIYSGKGEYAQGKFLPPKSSGVMEIDLNAIRPKIDAGNIALLQFYYEAPENDLDFEFKKIILSQTEIGAQTADTMIPAKIDLLKIAAEYPQILKPVECRYEFTPDKQALLLTFFKHKKGMDTWAGLYAMTNLPESGFLPAWGGKNIMRIAVENLTPDGLEYSPLSLSITSGNNKRYWVALNPVARNTVHRYEKYFNDYGLDTEQIAHCSFNLGIPSTEYKFKITQWEVEFDCESLAGNTLEELKNVAGQTSDPALKSKILMLYDHLRDSMNKVSGKEARKGNITAFLSTLEKARKELNYFSRSSNLQNAEQAMRGDYPYIVALADSMDAVMLKDFKLKLQKADSSAKLSLAGNEYEGVQVVIMPKTENLSKVSVSVTPPVRADEKKSLFTVDIGAIAHAETRKPPYPVDYTGFWPDGIIYGVNEMDLQAGETASFYVRFFAPAETPPGKYLTTITVSAKQQKPYSFPLELEVFDFSIPTRQPLPIAISMDPSAICHAYGYQLQHTEDGYKIDAKGQEAINRFYDLAQSYKLNPDYIYLRPEKKNSMNRFDFGRSYMAELKQKNLDDPYCIINASVLDPSVVDPDDPKIQEDINSILKHLDYFVPVMEKAGLRDQLYIYGFDEGIIGPIFTKVFGAVKKAYPDIETMTTSTIYSLNNPALNYLDIWVPFAYLYAENEDFVRRVRARGIKVWWYICNNPRPPEITFMLDTLQMNPRMLMGAMTMRYRPEGFLYWAVNAAHKGGEKASGLPRSSWNPATFETDNGEGSLFVLWEDQIRPTLRLENFRDGLEDYHYYLLLEREVKALEAKNFSHPALISAKSALKAPETLIKNTHDYTHDSSKVRALRNLLAEEIRKIRKEK